MSFIISSSLSLLSVYCIMWHIFHFMFFQHVGWWWKSCKKKKLWEKKKFLINVNSVENIFSSSSLCFFFPFLAEAFLCRSIFLLSNEMKANDIHSLRNMLFSKFMRKRKAFSFHLTHSTRSVSSFHPKKKKKTHRNIIKKRNFFFFFLPSLENIFQFFLNEHKICY